MKRPGLAALLVFGLSSSAAAQDANRTEAGSLESTATIHCIGLSWAITGDADHDATCLVEYRTKDAAGWKQGMNLLRTDMDRHNGFIGSLFNLEPGTWYEIRLRITDPDGGDTASTLVEKTRVVPILPNGGRTLHVIPGAGGGDGSEAAPFRGLRAAQEDAKPGDIFLLRPGHYGAFRFDMGGEAGRPVCWKGEGGAVLADTIPAASHLWFEGLTFQRGSPDREDGFKAEPSVRNLVLIRNRFTGFHHTIKIGRGGGEWHIADNVIEGDNDPVDGGLTGEGIELGKTSGNIVAHNRITRTADGVSYPGSDCDIYGNDIHDVSDDGIETDMGQTNNRIWGNRITNVCNNVFSWQPMNRGPWYFIRNQVVITRGKVFKFSTVNDRFAVIHNTFVFPKTASEYAQCLLNSYSRNNLYIATGDEAPLFRAAINPKKPDRPGGVFVPNWRSDVDYDGFDWGRMPEPFRWDGRPYKDIGSLSAAVGIWKHAVPVKRQEIFETWILSPATVLALKPGCAAVDAGAVVPNISDGFAGRAPDLGAHERGRPAPQYGPR